jgi:hypothetical protein
MPLANLTQLGSNFLIELFFTVVIKNGTFSQTDGQSLAQFFVAKNLAYRKRAFMCCLFYVVK